MVLLKAWLNYLYMNTDLISLPHQMSFDTCLFPMLPTIESSTVFTITTHEPRPTCMEIRLNYMRPTRKVSTIISAIEDD